MTFKKKLKLENLAVLSFITVLNPDDKEQLQAKGCRETYPCPLHEIDHTNPRICLSTNPDLPGLCIDPFKHFHRSEKFTECYRCEH